MCKIKCIMFDCMDTLIELKEKPELNLYASWAYTGSGCEDNWLNLDDFQKNYKKAVNTLNDKHEDYREYDIVERFRLLINNRFQNHDQEFKDVLCNKIYANYWKNYKANCYVREDVNYLLIRLKNSYRLGVVSNFMIRDGIEELLIINGIINYFDFVVTSIKTGWRKPKEIIYENALELANVSAEETLFIGDNIICDYEGPGNIGINSILLDKENRYEEVEERVEKLVDIEKLLNIENGKMYYSNKEGGR
jgi:putative hydrolase of the HAD superfamily